MQYDQSQLVHDILSLQSGFEVLSANRQPLPRVPEVVVEDYQWITFDPNADTLPPEATLVASVMDSHWYGIAA